MRKLIMAAVASAALATTPAAAQQSGLVNVNVTDIEVIKNSLNNNDVRVLNNNNVQVAAPINVQVPIGVAVAACGISVLAIREAGDTCTATNASGALGQAIAKKLGARQ